MIQDIQLICNNGSFDIAITSDGDIATVDSIGTAIQMSLFCDATADAAEVANVNKRNGWIGDALYPDQAPTGSKLWLLQQSRLNGEIFNKARFYTVQALEWLKSDGLAKDVVVNARPDYLNQSINMQILITRPDGNKSVYSYRLFVNTGWAELLC